MIGADGRIRTADLLITNQLLYRLSYIGVPGFAVAGKNGFIYIKVQALSSYCVITEDDF